MRTRRRIRKAVAAASAGIVLTLGLSQGAAQAAPTGTYHGCPKGYVCIYPQDAGWGNDVPTHMFYYYGSYNLVNQYGIHRIMNNQTDGAKALFCLNYGGTNCVKTLNGGSYTDYNLTPINSIKLTP